MVVGEYQKAFAIMKLDGDYSNRENVTSEMDSAYLHEYIHFIQDFGTCYGINQSVYRLSRYLEMIKQVKEGNYSGYLKLSDEADFVISLFLCAAGYYAGDVSDTVCHVVNKIEIREEKEYYEEKFPQHIDLFKPSVIVKYNNGKEFEFGGEAVAESMAYLFERIFYNATDYNKCLPYNSCEIIYNEIMKKPCSDIKIMVALCYASLMTHFPGYTFYLLVKIIKGSNKIPENMKEVFEVAKDLMEDVNAAQMQNLEEAIDYVLPIIESDVAEKPTYKPFMYDLKYCNNWLKNTYRQRIKDENKLRNTLIYILEEENISLRKARMRKLMEIIEKPLLIDRTGKLYSDDKHLTFLLAPYALQQTIMNKQMGCAMLPVCRAYKKGTSDKCGENWWRKEISNKICLMRFYLSLMDLENIHLDKLLGCKY